MAPPFYNINSHPLYITCRLHIFFLKQTFPLEKESWNNKLCNKENVEFDSTSADFLFLYYDHHHGCTCIAIIKQSKIDQKCYNDDCTMKMENSIDEDLIYKHKPSYYNGNKY